MNKASLASALECAVEAAGSAGRLLRKNWRAPKKINAATQHDLKLELDVRCQNQIERILRRAFPSIPILGEEGILGDSHEPTRWVVDPIDGTVNFAYGIPHCCTAIALQTIDSGQPVRHRAFPGGKTRFQRFHTVLGVIYDPFCEELWTVTRDKPSRLNGRIIRASARSQLSESVVSIGFAKERKTLRRIVPAWHYLIHRVRKVRIMGSAALALAYVASGRMDAFLEYGLRIWDIAAGGLLIESAGGRFWSKALRTPDAFHIIASNAPIHHQFNRFR